MLFSRYSNVLELLGTFSTFDDVKNHLIKLLDITTEEEIYEYYIHKSVMSDVSFGDFREQIMKNIKAKQMTDEEVDEVMQEAFKYIKPR